MSVATRTEALPRVAPLVLRHWALPAVVAAGVFSLAFANGGFDPTTRAAAGVAVWWAIVLGVGLGLWPLARTTAAAHAAALMLVGLAALTLASAQWGASAERAFAEFDRVLLYLGVFLLAVLAGTRANADRWCDGIAAAIAAVAVLALAERLAPGLFDRADYPAGLEDAELRLSYPLGYWNGLAIFLALGLPLLLRAGVSAATPVGRAAAIGIVPALVAAMYLTSSRGGVVTVVAVLAAYLALTPRRLAAAGALLVAALGSLGAIAILLDRATVADAPAAATSDDRLAAAAVIAASCLLTALVHAATALIPRRGLRVPRAALLVAAVLVLAGLAAAVVAADPAARFEAFTQSPEEAEGFDETGFTRTHIVSTEGTGRWQFWVAAVDQFRSEPIAGGGAGSYEAWWAQHGSFAYAIRDAHSLYLETLGELGVVGLFLLVGFFATALAVGFRRLRRASGEERHTLAAIVGAALAFSVAAGIDWLWELPAVTTLGVLLFGLLVGPATAIARGPRKFPADDGHRSSRRPGAFVAFSVVALGWIAVCVQAVLLLSAVELRNSQAAAAQGDLVEALEDARGAEALQPWAATPRLQVALVQEQLGRLPAALDSVREAVERDPTDWRLRIVAARIEAKAGLIEDARESLAAAERLNPRSRFLEELRS